MPDIRSRNHFIDYAIERISDFKEDFQRFVETRSIEIATMLTVCGLFYWIQQYVST